MNKLFGLAIAVVVTIALLTVFKEQTTDIVNSLFSRFSTAISSGI